jgi:hypothetical protein
MRFISKAVGHIEYNDEKVFSTIRQIDYEDSYITLKGKLVSANLYDINDNYIAAKLASAADV